MHHMYSAGRTRKGAFRSAPIRSKTPIPAWQDGAVAHGSGRSCGSETAGRLVQSHQRRTPELAVKDAKQTAEKRYRSRNRQPHGRHTPGSGDSLPAMGRQGIPSVHTTAPWSTRRTPQCRLPAGAGVRDCEPCASLLCRDYGSLLLF